MVSKKLPVFWYLWPPRPPPPPPAASSLKTGRGCWPATPWWWYFVPDPVRSQAKPNQAKPNRENLFPFSPHLQEFAQNDNSIKQIYFHIQYLLKVFLNSPWCDKYTSHYNCQFISDRLLNSVAERNRSEFFRDRENSNPGPEGPYFRSGM